MGSISLSFVPKGWGSLSAPMQRMLLRAEKHGYEVIISHHQERTAKALVRRKLMKPAESCSAYRITDSGIALVTNYHRGQKAGDNFMRALRGKP